MVAQKWDVRPSGVRRVSTMMGSLLRGVRDIYYVNGRTATVDQECCWQSDISKEFLVVQDSADVKSQKRDVKS